MSHIRRRFDPNFCVNVDGRIFALGRPVGISVGPPPLEQVCIVDAKNPRAVCLGTAKALLERATVKTMVNVKGKEVGEEFEEDQGRCISPTEMLLQSVIKERESELGDKPDSTSSFFTERFEHASVNINVAGGLRGSEVNEMLSDIASSLSANPSR